MYQANLNKRTVEVKLLISEKLDSKEMIGRNAVI